MPFEIFHRKSVRINSPAITLSPSGRIYLNQGAVECLVSRRRLPYAVLFLWDERTKTAAIKAATDTDERAYRVAYSDKGSGATITAKSFLSWIGFPFAQSITVPADWKEKQRLLSFQLPFDE